MDVAAVNSLSAAPTAVRTSGSPSLLPRGTRFGHNRAMVYLYVALGGALGSVARFALANAMAVWTGAEFPWGTLLINVLGSFVISFFGLLTGTLPRFAVPPEIRIFVTVGLCGGFTTFSSFSLQTVELLRTGQPTRAGLYIAASVILCLAACALGVAAAACLSQPRPA